MTINTDSKEEVKPKKKTGRPKGYFLAIDDIKKKEILAVLHVGSTRNTAADYVGVGRSTLSDTIKRDDEFAEQIKRAEAQGKLKHEQKIYNADAWQASAWHLERKYPEEYGRKHAINHTVEALSGAIEIIRATRPD